MDYYDWQACAITCRTCGWAGLGEDLKVSEIFLAGAEYVCPSCSHDFGFKAFPSAEQARSDGRAAPEDRRALERADQRWSGFQRTKLESPHQLPDLQPCPTVVVWDEVESARGDREVQLLHAERILWRELSWHWNFERFEEIARILKLKYRDNLIDLVPTARSHLYLFGDSLSAPGNVTKVRARIADGSILDG